MTSERIRVAVVGLGMGMFHVDCYQNNPGTELVAVCDSNKQIAERVAERLEIPVATTDYKELLKDDSIDAVSVATPVFLHAPMTIDFLKAGKHVLVEKPMAHTVEEASEMAAAAAQAGKLLSIHHNRRYDPDTQFIKKCIEEERFGKIYLVKTGWKRLFIEMLSPDVEREGVQVNRNWFNERDKGGGVLLDLGTHMVDRMMYLIGFPELTKVMGSAHNELGKLQASATGKKFDAEDIALGLAQFSNGVTALLEVSFGSYIAEGGTYIEIYGSKAGLCERNSQIQLIEQQSGAMKVSTIAHLPQPQFANPVDDFIAAIKEGREPMITADQGVAVMKVLDGIRQSAFANL